MKNNKETCRDYNQKTLKRICGKCRIEKYIQEFHRKINGTFGHATICKICKGKQDKDYRKQNPEYIKKYLQNWLKSNREKRNEISKRYYLKNKDKHLVLIRNRRARLVNAKGTFTKLEWEQLKSKSEHKCQICGLREPFNQYRKYLTIDHIIPISKGGENYISNIQPLCFNCNSVKKDKVKG